MIDPAPIDRTHQESLSLIESIRAHTRRLRDQAAMWQPGPMPDEWDEPPTPRPIRITRRKK